MGIAKRYKAESEARDLTVPSGFVFRVRGMTKVEFARVLGGLPLLVKASNDEDQAKADQERNAKLERDIYDEFVDGIVDPETGAAEKVAYDDVLAADLDPVLMSAMRRGGLTGAKADAIRGAL